MDLSNVRVREHFGLLTNDTHTGKFNFLISPPKNRGSVETGEYVLVDHPLFGDTCQVLASVKEIASYEEVAGSTIGDRLGKMLATTEIIGYVDLRTKNRPLQTLLTPPNPGSRVYIPLAGFLEDILNRNLKGEPFTQPLILGKINTHTNEAEPSQNQITCFIDGQDLTTKHTLIAAMTGTGKTQLLKNVIQELANKTQTPIVIIDSAGEYSDLQPDDRQVSIIAAKSEKASRKAHLKAQIKSLNEKTEKETLAKEVKSNRIVILNGEGLTVEERRPFYGRVLKLLWRNRTDEITAPFFLVVEEAEDLKGDALEQMITEGRKNGISICLVAIHPIELGGRVLSQMGNQIVGKTIDKNDLEYLANMANKSCSALQNLAVGEWIVSGVNRPISLKVKSVETTGEVQQKSPPA